MTFSINQQIEEVEREIKMRESVYPRWVDRGKMKKSEAEFFLARMRAVLKTLQWLQRNKASIKNGNRDPAPAVQP